MACDAITQILQTESGRIGPEIYKRVFMRSPWIRLIQRGTFPKEMGQTINVLTYERTAPTDAEPTWQSMVFDESNPIEGGICLPPVTNVGIGSTLRSYNLARIALKGPEFCSEQLRTPFEVSQQLNAIVSVLAAYSVIEWEIRDRHEYFRAVKYKVVIDGCPGTSTSTQASTYPASCPTAMLTVGILNRWKAILLRDGAAESAMGMVDGSPILTAVMSYELSDNLIFTNADIRQDLRWGKPSELLAPFGVDRSYRGFYYLTDPYPRRFSCSGGVYTEIAAFTEVSATKGFKAEVNPSWTAATLEETFIFDPMVMQQLIPEPVTAPGANLTFNPVNYMGQWQYLNIPNAVCNPLGTIGFHYGVLAAATKPIYPERGVAFVGLRCDPPCNLVTSCS